MKILLTISMFFAVLSISAQDYTIENNEVKITKTVGFKTGSATLLPESDEALNIIKAYLNSKTYISLLRIEGHVVAASEKLNQHLSEERAMAVCRRLIELGIDCNRLLAAGFGSTKPVMENNTPGGRAANNRISFVNAKIKDKAIGGMPVDGGGKIAGELCN